jgi:hypothetical protein
VNKNVLGTIGQCIYCGCAEGLSKEHIVPYGLGASWLLLKASCPRHRDITSKFELNVLRNLWGPVRAAIGMQSRHGHSSKRFPLVVRRNGSEEIVQIDPARFGAPLMFPQFEAPRYLSGRIDAADLSTNGYVTHILPSPERFKAEIKKEYSPKEIDFSITFQPVAFAQMLAKLAFGFAIARHGLAAIEGPYMIEALETGKQIGRWVGCDGDGIPLSKGSDDIEVRLSFINTPTRDIVAEIKLFGRLESPTYVVVVGKPKPEILHGVTFPDTVQPGSAQPVQFTHLSKGSSAILKP